MVGERMNKLPRGMRLALIGSVALNLILAGILGGAVLRGAPEMRAGPPGAVLPLTRALEEGDRRVVGRAIRETIAEAGGPADRAGRRAERRAMLDAVLESLRAEPFDPEAFQAATAKQAEHSLAFAKAGRIALSAHLAAMSSEARRAYADRVEDIALTRRRR